MVRGRATPEGTRGRAGDRPGYRQLGTTGLLVSSIGFGGYRAGRSDPAHRASLREALRQGVNLIDTSSNYMLGDSELLVGEVLAGAIVPREQTVLVSKVGYVQGPNQELARQREAEGRPFPEMVKYQESCWHCISPEFLEDQLGRALERLGVETLDVLLLHNPEYFLSETAHQDNPPPLEPTRDAFYDRLWRAFAYLDQAVGEGRISAYGVSSNTCVVPGEQYDATSVTRMVQASDGRMAVLQLPYNLFEAGALLQPNTPDGSALESAQRHGLGVLANRPLNAFARGRLVRLADEPRDDEPGSDRALRSLVEQVREQEALLGRWASGAQPPATATIFDDRWDETKALETWDPLVRGEIVPEARRGLGDVLRAAGPRPSPEIEREVGRYQQRLHALFERLQERAQLRDPRVSAQIRAALERFVPPALLHESLSRLALDFVVSTPGVTSALNGMRHLAYVHDAVGVMAMPPLPDVRAIAEAFSRG
ncbi:MAG: aldo/keto reductase [Chloroflexi bacterium]|nr:aldo/keto reductase [Chloroflexota bacterium]